MHTLPAATFIPVARAEAGRCRFCGGALDRVVIDLGVSPLANAYLRPADLTRPEVFYPLRALLCERCFLVQLEAFETPERIFGDYAYHTSYSGEMVRNAEAFAREAIRRYDLGRESLVLELASNDGYLLRHFVLAGIPVLGVEPAANVAKTAIEQGIPTRVRFFGEALAEELVGEGVRADLVVANNVLAHVPELNDFIRGIKVVLEPGGVATLEFPHLLRLLEDTLFDTIYHEHFSYFSFVTVERIFASHGLVLFDVEEIPTHGGSLRIHARHEEDASRSVSDRVVALREREIAAGLLRAETYAAFAERVHRCKRRLLAFLIEARERGESVVGYGAPAKASTLLNFCGVGPELIEYTVDKSPHKQGRYLPGSRIPIHPPGRIFETRPDFVVIFPWNLRDEIVAEMAGIREWGGRFVVPLPEVEVVGW